MSLLKSIKVELSEFHKERIGMIDNFDYSKVRTKVDKDLGGVPKSYLDTGIENLKKYYVVALLDPKNKHAVSRPVDPFWHSHVLFTKDYQKFCKDIFGGYVHHEPLDENDSQKIGKVEKLYDYTLDIYDDMFNDLQNEWWPKDGFSGNIKVVCLHMELTNPVILENALFPTRNFSMN